MESKEDDLIYILIPFIGAFLILFSMCCYEKKSRPEEPQLQGDPPVVRGATSIEMMPMMNTNSQNDSEGGEPPMVSDFNDEMVAADEGVCIDVQSVADDTNHSNSASLDYVAAERQDGQEGQDGQSMSESMDSAMIIVYMDSADEVSSLQEVDR